MSIGDFIDVEQYYNNNAKLESERLSQNSSEYVFTKYLLEKYNIKNCSVLDMGGGTGVYALPLSKENNSVTLTDISEKELEIAREMADRENVSICTVKQNAIEHNSEFDNSFDAVLCLGPLYHCSCIEDVENVINNNIRYAKPGGKIFMSFLSKYSKCNDFVKKCNEAVCIDLIKLRENYMRVHTNEQAFIFEKRGRLAVSFVTPDKLQTFFEGMGITTDIICSIDYLSDVCYPDERLDLLIELGKTIKLNSGSHILVVLEKRI